jgi:hypothetical protein
MFFSKQALPKNRGTYIESQNWHQPVWCCNWSGRRPTGLIGGSDRSDRSRRNPTIIRVLNRFRSVNKITCEVSFPHPINIKGHGRLKTQPNRIYQKHIFYPFTLFSLPYFSNLDMLFFPRLHGVWRWPSWPAEHRQLYARLPWRGPS